MSGRIVGFGVPSARSHMGDQSRRPIRRLFRAGSNRNAAYGPFPGPLPGYRDLLVGGGFFSSGFFGFGRNKFAAPNSAFAGDAPEVHGCVGSPRPPSFGATLKLTSTGQPRAAQKREISGWKRIRLPQRSHRYVLCGPFPDPMNFT